jgi:hypothetical protein
VQGDRVLIKATSDFDGGSNEGGTGWGNLLKTEEMEG